MAKAPKAAEAAKPEAAATKTAQAFKPTVKRALTLPLLKLEFDTPVFIRVDSEVYKGKQIKGTGKNAEMEPADLIKCTDLVTGEMHEMIVGTVLHGVFDENFEGNSYVDKCFQISKHKKEGKRYHTYKVLEIEDPAA